MAISILAQAVVDKSSGGSAVYTHGGFAVPGGTTRLLVQVEYRAFSDAVTPAVSSVTHNGDAVSFLAGSTTDAGFDRVTTWWGERSAPDVGTFNVVVTFPSNVRGCKLWLLAISGEKASGSILGQSAFQRKGAAATNTVSLGLTPAASGDSMLLASLAISLATTLSSWTGAGFVAVDTDSYTGGGNLTSTSRYLLNAPGGGATNVSATFAASDLQIGGSFIEILAEPVGTDVSDTFGVAVTVSGSTGIGSSASIADASYRRLAAWTEALSIQPDVAGAERRIVSAGPETAPNLTLDQTSTFYRATWRTTDGVVIVESAAGSQSVAAQHLAVVAGEPGIYLDGLLTGSVVQGGDLVGITDIGTGGQSIGARPSSPLAAYTGLVGRYLLYPAVMSPEQIRLMALSEKDPDAIWGYGVEDDAAEFNQSIVACPLEVTLDGQPNALLDPVILDPAGGTISITSVTQPVNGTLSVSGSNRLFYTPTAGWQGSDIATYTASDGSKQSSGKLMIRQRQPSLKAVGDSITVAAGGSVTFDPRINDVGAGPLRVVAVSQGSLGDVAILADGRISYTHSGGGDPGDPGDPGGSDDDLPTALRTIAVSNASQLTAALAGNFTGLTVTPTGGASALQAGDQIICAAGTYAGTFTISVDGTTDNPIAIRGAALNTATFTGKIAMNGDYNGVRGLRFTGDGAKIEIRKDDATILHNLFSGGTADGKVQFLTTTNRRANIARNRFSDFTGAAIRGNIDSSAEVRGSRIARNYFDGHTCTAANESVIIILTDMFNDSDLVIEYNLFNNVLIGAGPGEIIAQKELVTVKTQATTLRGNTVTNSTTGIFFSIREANDCVIEDNWFEGGSYVRVGNDGHTIRNNRASPDTNKVIELSSGDAYATDSDPPICSTFSKAGKTRLVLEGGTTASHCTVAHCAARDCVVEHNRGGIQLGDSNYDGAGAAKVSDITLQNNSAACTKLNANVWDNGSVTETGIGSNATTAVKLLTSQVGPGS